MHLRSHKFQRTWYSYDINNFIHFYGNNCCLFHGHECLRCVGLVCVCVLPTPHRLKTNIQQKANRSCSETDVTVSGKNRFNLRYEQTFEINASLSIHKQNEWAMRAMRREWVKGREKVGSEKNWQKQARSFTRSLAICNLKTVILPLWNIIYRMVLTKRQYVVVCMG